MKSSSLIALCAVAIVATTPIAAKPKKAKPALQSAPAVTTPRIPGYAVLSLENGNKDRVRVAEGQSMATLPNIITGDVDLITVVGPNTVLTVYDDANFRGHSLTLHCGYYELLQEPRNAIQSAKASFVKEPVDCQGSGTTPVQYKTWSR